MTCKEQIAALMADHFAEWVVERRKAFDDLADKLGMFCACGRLATGLHLSRCKKFNTLVDKETLSRLSHLIKTR